jgi:hypothetical protein
MLKDEVGLGVILYRVHMEKISTNTRLLHFYIQSQRCRGEGKGRETMCKVKGAISSLIIFHHGPTAAKLSSLRMLETDTFIIERAQAHEAHANKPPVPTYDRPHLRGPWSRLAGGWCEAEEKKRRRRGRREGYLYWTKR